MVVMRHSPKVPGKITAALLAVLVSVILWDRAQGAWFVDQERFHMSAHGQVSCQDCHERISGRPLHPDPADVNKSRAHFFDAEVCYSCHDGVKDDLDAGRHGSREGVRAEKYRYCIRCHRPHEVPGEGEEKRRALAADTPRAERCGVCHDKRDTLPALDSRDEECMACHRLPDPKDPGHSRIVARFCLHCHGGGKGALPVAVRARVPIIDSSEYVSTPHAKTACTACHPEAARFGHGSQAPGDCGRCHAPHDEKTAHDLHARVSCGACHLPGVRPVLDRDGQVVVWERPLSLGKPSGIHHMILMEDEKKCSRCHTRGNRVGAAAMVLPPKGILCMPCHASTFSVGDPVTLGGLGIFILGLVFLTATWFAGAHGGILRGVAGGVRTWAGAFFSVGGLRAFFLDVLLQRRLYRQSEGRWVIHALIFYPFLFRFVWGIAGLLGSLWSPESEIVRWMLDKNAPAAALSFDISGLLLGLGILLAVVRGVLARKERAPGLPRQDYLSLGLLGAIVAVGFVLEGIRIAMTGRPAGAAYAFVGNWVASQFGEADPLINAYGYVWYGHAVLTAAFIAYLPFSRLIHVILAPVVLVLNAGSHGKGPESRRRRTGREIERRAGSTSSAV
ncbi:MAG: respiratory nitrate reductase subunit gamma [Deltaproteobacteria bacterium]|nr:respiratory nitrate reductase subunit gamma [Deltaproteobacteria bacterium]